MALNHEFNLKEQKRKKVAMLGVSSVMLLAMVVAVTIGIKETGHKIFGHDDGLATSSRAAKSVCHTVLYQRSCQRALAHVHTTEPKKLVQSIFKAALQELQGALAKSSTFKADKDDRRSEGALETCKEVMEYAIEDLKRSIDQMGRFDIHKKGEHVENMRVWLSGALTLQETCIDSFVNTTGDVGEKMKKLLNTSRELTSNGVDVAEGLELLTESDIVNNHHNHSSHNHRSLIEEGKESKDEELPDWTDTRQRKLLYKEGANINANVVVAKDGTGKYKTITEALKQVPVLQDETKVGTNVNETFVIYIKEGVYEEEIRVKATMSDVMLVGDGPTKTKITGKKSFANGFVPYKTATAFIIGSNFIAKDIGFENLAGAKNHQAIALLVQSDMSIFYNCHIDGYMDTLNAHSYRQFYRHCTISGTVDIIFGNAAAVFQNCKLVIRKPLDDQQCVITAQDRVNDKEPSGFVLQNCTVMADPTYHAIRDKNKAFLGRPSKKYSKTIFMQSYLGDSISPDGWKSSIGKFGQNTCVFGEFENRGPGAGLSGRVVWRGIQKLTKKVVEGYTPAKFFGGDRWIRPTKVPYESGLMPT